MGTVHSEDMSGYEKRAWEQVLAWRQKQLAKRERRLPKPLRGTVNRARELAAEGWDKVPGNDAIQRGLLKAVEGLHELVTDTAIRTLRPNSVLAAYTDGGHPVAGLDDIRKLDLEAVDARLPDLSFRYAVAIGAEGAAAGAAMGGAAVLAAGGGMAGAGAGAVPGAAAAITTMTADIAALLTGSTRGVAHTLAYYGYDVRRPEERAFMLATMSLGLVTGQVAKQKAFAQLHKLVGLLARDATWKILNQDAFVRLTGALFAKLGERLVKQKLGQLLPAAGAVIGGGMNYSYVRRVTDAAYWLGRERFLMDKYGLHPPVDLEGDEGIAEIEILSDEPREESQ